MEINANNHSSQQKGISKTNVKAHLDEREKANNGDWGDQRDGPETKSEDHDANQNDNTGGAGSTGSAATNS